jgi:hypothetical protein
MIWNVSISSLFIYFYDGDVKMDWVSRAFMELDKTKISHKALVCDPEGMRSLARHEHI